jgi:hypothetical protein
MAVNGFWLIFGLGCFGGVAAEAFSWYKLRTSPNLPAYSKSLFYWGITILFIIIGGILASLYGTSNVNAILAANIGASAPLIVAALLGTAPKIAEQKSAQPFGVASKPKLSLRAFLGGY